MVFPWEQHIIDESVLLLWADKRNVHKRIAGKEAQQTENQLVTTERQILAAQNELYFVGTIP